LVYTWARYWQLADQLDILQQFEDNEDNESIVLFADTLREKEIKPEMKILSKMLKMANFDLRQDHKRLTKKTNKQKKFMPHADDVKDAEAMMAKDIELRRIARVARRAKGEALIPKEDQKNVEEVESSDDEVVNAEEDDDDDEDAAIVDLDDEEEEVLSPGF